MCHSTAQRMLATTLLTVHTLLLIMTIARGLHAAAGQLDARIAEDAAGVADHVA
jgi:hypothetical protein